MKPYFFKVLGIEPTQDVDALKRAHAAALAQVDQRTQPEAFEALWSAYDLAKFWCDLGGESSVLFDSKQQTNAFWTQVYAFQSKQIRDEAAQAARRRVFASSDMRAPSREAVERWEKVLCVSELTQAGALLERALRDGAMADSAAAFELERRILSFLSQNQMGDFGLFDAAAQRFGWREDVRHLEGSEGFEWLVKVLNQELFWQAQSASVRLMLSEAIELVLREAHSSGLSAEQREALRVAKWTFPEWVLLRVGRKFLAPVTSVDEHAQYVDKGLSIQAAAREAYFKRFLPREIFQAFVLLIVILAIVRTCTRYGV